MASGIGELGRLHVITDVRPGRDPLAVTGAALAAGAPVVQVRAKGLTDRDLYELACRVAELCTRHDATCVVNDRADVALAVGADGVHVGQDDLPVSAVRDVVDPGVLVGGTARDPETARRLEAEGAAYLGVGPCYGTSTKSGLPAPLGPARLGSVAAAVDIPVIAIAGVTVARVGELLEAGAHGVAVVGAISDAPDPRRATEALLAAIESAGR